MSAYIKKKTISNKSDFLHFKKLKEEQVKLKASRRKELVKTILEIHEIGNRKTIEKINKSESWLFEKINKIDKLINWPKKKENGLQLLKWGM